MRPGPLLGDRARGLPGTRARRALALVAVLVVAPAALRAEPIAAGRVVAIADGDTLTLLDASSVQHRIRLAGIDAPEEGQAFGQRARENLSRLAFGREVRTECQKRDRYGREVCKVWVQPLECPTCGLTLDVGLAQLTQGLAWHYRKYEREQTPEDRGRYAFAEEEARMKKAGLWSEPSPVAPWDWRAPRRR